MATSQRKGQKTPRAPKRPRNVNITALLAALPPLILAIVELIKTGRALGWW